MPLTVGGGVRTVEDIRKLLLAGADKVSINTAAVNEPGFRPRGGGEVRQPVHRRRHRRQEGVGGGRAGRAGKSSPMAAAKPPASMPSRSPRKVAELGAGELLVTSMDRDGTKGGYDLALVRAIADAVSVPVIASGGVGNLDHLVAGIRDGHASAVLAASIFHFGTLHDRRGEGAYGARPAALNGAACDSAPAARRRTGADDRSSPSTTSPGSSPSAPPRRRPNPIRRSFWRTDRRRPRKSSARRRSRR